MTLSESLLSHTGSRFSSHHQLVRGYGRRDGIRPSRSRASLTSLTGRGAAGMEVVPPVSVTLPLITSHASCQLVALCLPWMHCLLCIWLPASHTTSDEWVIRFALPVELLLIRQACLLVIFNMY